MKKIDGISMEISELLDVLVEIAIEEINIAELSKTHTTEHSDDCIDVRTLFDRSSKRNVD
jgi:hypothetical protein